MVVAPAAMAHAGPWVRSCWYRVTPSSGLTLGETISKRLNWDVTWKSAPAFLGRLVHLPHIPSYHAHPNPSGQITD
jgi:hypothetical protein